VGPCMHLELAVCLKSEMVTSTACYTMVTNVTGIFEEIQIVSQPAYALACYGYRSLEESEGCMCYVVVYVCV